VDAGGPQVDSLAELTHRVDRLVPRDATVLVHDNIYPESERRYLLMWVAWLLPRHRVLLPEYLHLAPGRPAYRLEIPPRVPHPEAGEVTRTDAGALVRLGMP
jgi:hypothetical protein